MNKDNAYAQLLGSLVAGQEAVANRPQKNFQQTVTNSTEVPLELADMRMRRDTIGSARTNLANALLGREQTGYGIANALMQMPQRQGLGSWAGDAVRMFGAGLTGRANAAMDNAQKDYDASRADLADALNYDKAMGNTQNQVQTQTIGYDGSSAKTGSGSGIGGYLATPTGKFGSNLHELNTAAGKFETNRYNPSDPNQGFWSRQGTALMRGTDYGLASSNNNPENPDFKRAKDFQQLETSGIQGMFDVLKVLRPATDTDVMVALRTAGADPVLSPEVRDQRMTRVINQELSKAGLPRVQNLAEWDKFVNTLNGMQMNDGVGNMQQNQADYTLPAGIQFVD